MMAREWPEYTLFKTVMLAGDNTARKGLRACIYENFTIDRYEGWLSKVCRRTIERYPEDERLVFIHSWNAWAEGSYLEPDQKFGREYLSATRRALLMSERVEDILAATRRADLSDEMTTGILRHLDNKDATERLLVKTIEKKEEEISELKKETEQLQAVVAQKEDAENRARDLAVRLSEKDREIDVMRSSRIWKMAEKLRVIIKRPHERA
jgi:lipopolysaccharide biosynthesis protein